MDRLDRTGIVNYEKHERRKCVVNEHDEFDVLATVVEDPHSSTAEISHDLGIGQTSVKRILTKNKYHPYHVQLNQALEGQDFENRIYFCNWGRARIQEDALFLNTVMFTDKATFHNNGPANRHNLHFYADVNPNFVRLASIDAV
nr:unnamed protein product [Callosobruchus chinensis]